LFRPAGKSVEDGAEADCKEGRDTWLTELLARASREEDEDYQDFAPKSASANHASRDHGRSYPLVSPRTRTEW
jgi:hypothetical protein